MNAHERILKGIERLDRAYDQWDKEGFAEALFEREAKEERDPLQPRWGHSTCLAFMGDLYSDRRDYQQAKMYYLRALQVNPNDSPAKKGVENHKELL